MEIKDSALAQVRRANRSISRLYNLVLSSCGLAATQYVLLQSIAAAREISQLQLSEQLSVASTTLSRRLSGLKKKGLVDLRLGARGSRIYSLTPAGRALLSSTSRQWESAQYRLRSALGEKDWQLFIHVCDRVCEAAKVAETMRVAFSRGRAANQNS
ncbi:MAG: MarR family winged helix-turn-helix transcriptional regulator [Candidatus Sulfotelmatobacter sp.]